MLIYVNINNGEKLCEENKPYSYRKNKIKNFLHEKLLEVFYNFSFC